MTPAEPPPELGALVGQVVVLDLRSSYVCLGTLVEVGPQYFTSKDADLHDFRDSTATREVYVYDSVRLGIRRNRARVQVLRDEVIAIARFAMSWSLEFGRVSPLGTSCADKCCSCPTGRLRNNCARLANPLRVGLSSSRDVDSC